MKVLITGATGLIGAEILGLCRERNIAVNYLTTRKEKIASNDNLRGFLWNPNANEIDLECFTGVSAIVNLAGASISKRWTARYKKKIVDSRVKALRTLYYGLEKVDRAEIDSFVSASAIGIYPHSLDSLYIEDETTVDNSFLGTTVASWEKEADAFFALGLRVAKIRIGLVMSANGGALPTIAKPVKNYMGAAFGNGEQWQSWIHIKDLAGIFLFAIENGLQGVYNGVAPNPVTNTKLTKELARVLDRPLILPNLPRLPIKILLGEMSYLLFSSQRVSSKKIEEEGFVFRYQNICRALERIYREPKTIELANAPHQKEA